MALTCSITLILIPWLSKCLAGLKKYKLVCLYQLVFTGSWWEIDDISWALGVTCWSLNRLIHFCLSAIVAIGLTPWLVSLPVCSENCFSKSVVSSNFWDLAFPDFGKLLGLRPSALKVNSPMSLYGQFRQFCHKSEPLLLKHYFLN